MKDDGNNTENSRSNGEKRPSFDSLIGESRAMNRLRHQLVLASRSDPPCSSILLLGEPGTGKTAIAKLLHENGPFRRRPFVAVQCGQLSPNLFESELFGTRSKSHPSSLESQHDTPIETNTSLFDEEPTPFSDEFGKAVHSGGLLERAALGTLLLDEVACMPVGSQTKLLSFLPRPYRSQSVEHPAQIIFISRLSLDENVGAGSLTRDFCSRIQTNVIRVPSLRERGPEDIKLLLAVQLRQILGRQDTQTPPHLEDYFTPAALKLLLEHAWPGNIRELQLFCKHFAVAWCLSEGTMVGLQEVRAALELDHQVAEPIPDPRWQLLQLLPKNLRYAELQDLLKQLTAEYVRERISENKGNIALVAQQMECSRATLYKLTPTSPQS